MLDASGYGCLAAHRKGERLSASSYKFVNVYFPASYILLYLVSGDCGGSASCTVVIVRVCHLLLLNIGIGNYWQSQIKLLSCLMSTFVSHLTRQADDWMKLK